MNQLVVCKFTIHIKEYTFWIRITTIYNNFLIIKILYKSNLDTETTYYSNEYDTLKNCNQLLNLPDVITSLSNLESL